MSVRQPIQYRSQTLTLVGAPQTVQLIGFPASYVEVVNEGASPYVVSITGQTFGVPAGTKLTLSDLTPVAELTVTGTGDCFVYWASGSPGVATLSPAQGAGGGGGTYSADNITLQEVLNQFSIRNLGVGTAQLANLAVTDPKIATDALSGYHVNRAINISPPVGQWFVVQQTAPLVAGDEVEIEVSYGPNGTVANQVFIFDTVSPGKITVPLAGTPLANLVTAINSWATTLAVPQPCLAFFSGIWDVWYLYATDEWSISVDSSYVALNAVPAAMTIQDQGGTSAPIPLSRMRIERTVTAAEATLGYFYCSPGTQNVYSGTLPTVTKYRYNFATWDTDNTVFYSVKEQPGTFGLVWLIGCNAVAPGDRFIVDFCSQQQPLTPRP